MNDYAFTAPSIMDVVIKMAGLGLLEMNYTDGQTFISAADGNAYRIIETDRPYLLVRSNIPLSQEHFGALKGYMVQGDEVPAFQGGDIIT